MSTTTLRPRAWRVYALSADSPEGLDRRAAEAAEVLAAGAEPGPAGEGTHRLAVVARDPAEAAELLRANDPNVVLRGEAGEPFAVLLLPGVGELRTGMVREAYHALPVFRAVLDDCSAQLAPLIGADLREHLLAEVSRDPESLLREGPEPLEETRLAQPAVFAVEVALAAQLEAWNVRPGALVGYSIGEYAAAAIAGVLALPDALRLVARRACLIDELPPGAMMLALLAEDEVASYLEGESGGVGLAAVNGPRLCVLSGPAGALAALGRRLAADAVVTMEVPTRHAFHSAMMAPLDAPLRELLAGVELRAPRIPFVSNVTGDWVSPAEVADPGYWARHMCRTVRFLDDLSRLWELPGVLAVEAGPGQMLTALANQHPRRASRPEAAVVAPLSPLSNRRGQVPALLGVAARAWVRGMDVPIADVSAGQFADKEESWTSH